MKQDYYEVLGIAQDADDRTIKAAYRRMAMENHPDRNSAPGAEEKFKAASEAYQVLSDPQKRQTYDRFGFEGLRSNGFSGFSGMGVEDIFSSFGDIFGDLFGFGRTGRRSGRGRGSDLRAELVLEFEEAVFGCEKEVDLEQMVPCDTCDGTGAKAGSQPRACPTCHGRGQVMHGQGMFLISTTCPDCQGQGVLHSAPCEECAGDGRLRARRTVHVKIPAGFDDGMSLRYAGEGEPGLRGGPAGDLYVAVHVQEHPTLKRDGDDLVTEAPLTMVQAALGAEIAIDGVEGEETISVPKGTQPGTVFTLKRKGVPRLRGGGRGHLHVVCRVEIPTSLSGKQRKLLEEFDELAKTKKKGLFS